MALDQLQRQILEAIASLASQPGQTAGDREIAARLGLPLQKLQDHLDLLQDGGYIRLSKTFGPTYSAWLEPRGRMALQRPEVLEANDQAGQIHIGSVGGDVTISQNQQGGITSHHHTATHAFKQHPIITAIGFLAAAVAILTYFGLTPSFRTATSPVFQKPQLESDTKPALPTDKSRPREGKGEPAGPRKERKSMDTPKDKVQIGEVKGDAVISINQSGGITAHTVVTSPPPRTLTDQQRTVLLATLKQYGGVKELETTQLFGDPEAKRYGEELIDAVAASG